MTAREAVFKIVHEVLYKKGYSNIVLEQMRGNHKYNGPDTAFITNLALGTLRNSLYLEYIISYYSNIKYNKISPAAAVVLKTGAYQILFMDRTPDSAACNESVKLAGKYAGHRTKGFVNAVLRKISREKGSVDKLIDNLSGNEYLSVKYSFSMEAVSKLIKQYGWDDCEKIMAAMNKPAETCIRFNDCPKGENPEEVLLNLGIRYKTGSHVEKAYYIKWNGPLSALDLYKDGTISIQDEGAQAIVGFLEPHPGEKILDSCASPGGKTIHIACLMQGTGEITACDIYPQRVENMKKNILRINPGNISCKEKDMTLHHPEYEGKFDKVLVDAPCSGLGTAQRRPEIKLKYSEDKKLYDLQRKILKECAGYVKPRGELVYSTCTLFSEENRKAVDALLSSSPEYSLSEEKTILPDGKTGGFYMAKIVRKS